MKYILANKFNLLLLNICISGCFNTSCQNFAYRRELTSIPIIFNKELKDGHIDGDAYINVKIDTSYCKLFLDTGYPGASINLTSKALEKVKVRFTGNTQKNYDWRGQEYEAREYILPKVTIGDLELTGIRGLEHRKRGGADGAISFKLLRQYNVLIDFPNEKMSFYKFGYLPEYLSNQDWQRVNPIIGPGGGFELLLTLDGIDQNFVFGLDNAAIALDDNQKPYGLIRLNSSLAKYLTENKLIKQKEDDTSIVGTFCTNKFRINGTQFQNLDFMIVDYKYPELDGLLGYNFFINHPIFIDFKNNELYIK